MGRPDSARQASDPPWIETLARIPPFDGLSRAALRTLARGCREQRHEAGEVVFREGDVGDCLFVVLGGELEVTRGGESEVLNRLGPGELFGEIPLLTGGKRTASVRALERSHLLAMEAATFDRYLARDPKVLAYIAREQSRRLATAARREPHRARAIHVLRKAGLARGELVAESLARLLGDLTGHPALLVGATPHGARSASLSELARMPADALRGQVERTDAGPARLRVRRPASNADHEAEEAVIGVLTTGFPHVVVDLGRTAARPPRSDDGLAHVLVEVVDEAEARGPDHRDGWSRAFQVVDLEGPASSALPVSHCEPFLMPRDAALPTGSVDVQARFVQRHPSSPCAIPLHRLARKILGRTVGLALGSGAAFAIAQVGVIEVLEREKIAVDLVAGTSFGSVIALGWALGLSGPRMREIALQIGSRRTLLSVLDPTVAKPGLMEGDRLVAVFQPFAGSARRFEELRRPCQVAALAVDSGERFAIDHGELLEALRAACAVPPIWVPVVRDGRVLVDGGFVDPVPVDLVYEMGANFCIAVNVIPPLDPEQRSLLSRLQRGARRLNPLHYVGERSSLPALSEVLGDAVYTLERQLARLQAAAADVCIEPKLSGFGPTQFHRPAELIERGVEAAEAALPEIRRVLAAR